MGYRLCTGVTCCRTGGFTFFLDVARDRYFAVGGVADAAFGRMIEGDPPEEHDAQPVKHLIRDRLIVATDDASRPEPCRHAIASASALDAADSAKRPPDVTFAILRITAARLSLKWAGLDPTLARLERRKLRQRPRAERTTLPAIAAAFERCNAIFSPLDQCLPRSIAVAHRLIDLGHVPTFLMGVRAEPFGAHAWVECDGTIVNDRFDTIEPYTPILAL